MVSEACAFCLRQWLSCVYSDFCFGHTSHTCKWCSFLFYTEKWVTYPLNSNYNILHYIIFLWEGMEYVIEYSYKGSKISDKMLFMNKCNSIFFFCWGLRPHDPFSSLAARSTSITRQLCSFQRPCFGLHFLHVKLPPSWNRTSSESPVRFYKQRDEVHFLPSKCYRNMHQSCSGPGPQGFCWFCGSGPGRGSTLEKCGPGPARPHITVFTPISYCSSGFVRPFHTRTTTPKLNCLQLPLSNKPIAPMQRLQCHLNAFQESKEAQKLSVFTVCGTTGRPICGSGRATRVKNIASRAHCNSAGDFCEDKTSYVSSNCLGERHFMNPKKGNEDIYEIIELPIRS